MIEPSSWTIAEFRAAHGLDLHPERRRIWLAQLGGVIIPIPNFQWRREIIATHDAHHLITGYPPTLCGELSVAAWELGTRCYRDPRARLLCAMLTALGILVQPTSTLKAFRAGRSFGRD